MPSPTIRARLQRASKLFGGAVLRLLGALGGLIAGCACASFLIFTGFIKAWLIPDAQSLMGALLIYGLVIVFCAGMGVGAGAVFPRVFCHILTPCLNAIFGGGGEWAFEFKDTGKQKPAPTESGENSHGGNAERQG